MRKIYPTIGLIVISLFLSGCISGSSGSSTGFSSGDSSSGSSVISYYDSSSSSGSSGSPGESAGHNNPEPSSLALLGAGLFGLIGSRLRKRGTK